MAVQQDNRGRQIARLVQHQCAHPPEQVSGRTRQEMAAELVSPARAPLDEAFDAVARHPERSQLPAGVAEYVKKYCERIFKALNELSEERRFFTLQTVNLFGEDSLVAKFIQLLLLEDNQTRKGLASLFLSTFKSTYDVIHTLTAKERLFARQGGESDKGELYVFQSDLARKLVKLFHGGFVKEQARKHRVEDIYPIELLNRIIETNSMKELRNTIVNNDAEIVKNLIDYVSLLQTHHALYIYGLKRYQYLKHFLVYELRKERRLKGLGAAAVNQIVAGALVHNGQLVPPEELIAGLRSEDDFKTAAVVSAENAFLDQLAPTTLDAVIRQVHTLIKKLADPSVEVAQVFAEVARLSDEEGILARLQAGFLSLIEQGIITVSDLVKEFGAVFRRAVESRRQVERRYEAVLEEVLEAPEKEAPPANRRYHQIKNRNSLEVLKLYRMVETDRVGLRGGEGKTIQRDFTDSSTVFNRDGQAVLNFKNCFFTLFNFFLEKEELNKVQRLEQPHPTGAAIPFHEWYVAFRIPNLDVNVMQGKPHLLCLGLNHFPRSGDLTSPPSTADGADDNELAPYVVLFVGNPTPYGSRRAVSRKIEGQGRTFNQLPLRPEHLPVVHQAVHDILHLLPDEARYWQADEVQFCISFLRRALARRRR